MVAWSATTHATAFDFWALRDRSRPTDNVVRVGLDTMIDMRHPLAGPARRMTWGAIEAALGRGRVHRDHAGRGHSAANSTAADSDT